MSMKIESAKRLMKMSSGISKIIDKYIKRSYFFFFLEYFLKNPSIKLKMKKTY